MKKKIGIGTISFVLAPVAFLWAFEIMGFCLGDSILETLNIPTWSNVAEASGTHYTIFYSVLFLIPAIPIAIKYKDDLFANVGKWLSIAMCSMLLLGLVFMVV